MGCSFTQEEEKLTPDSLDERVDKAAGRLSKRLRKINCRSEVESISTSISENVKKVKGEELSPVAEAEIA